MNHRQASTKSPPERVRALAQSLDYFTEHDLCELCDITPATAETWRKRHKGPTYALVGNQILYPRAGVRDFLDSQIRQRNEGPGRDVL